MFQSSTGWVCSFRNPLVMKLLDYPDQEATDAYLASLLFSAINRESSRVSDAQDIAFQTALARQAFESQF